MYKSYKGVFRPKNPEKYIGNPSNIIYRSFMEFKYMLYLDSAPHVLQWGSEEKIVPYISPIDGKKHRYFPDMVVKAKLKDGSTKKFMIEIKPEKQTIPPVQTEKKTKHRFLTEVAEWGRNSAKWEAAKRYCEHEGWEFVLITEKDLNIKYK